MIHSAYRPQTYTQFCLACGAQICACHGTARGQCPVCFRGLLSQYYKERPCGYKGCKERAVAATPRVGFACLKHATERGGYDAHPERLEEYRQDGPLAPYSFTLRTRLEQPS